MNCKTTEQVQELIKEYERDQRALRQQMHQIMWHMRSMGREEAWTLSLEERKDCLKLIDEHIKLVERTKLPLL